MRLIKIARALTILCLTIFLASCAENPDQQLDTQTDQPPKLSLRHPRTNDSESNGVVQPRKVASLPSVSSKSTRDPDVTESQFQSRALLIGCSNYDNPEITDLRGPDNDVRFFREILINKFEFPDDDKAIVVLSDKSSRRATRANIEREFENLARSVSSGSQVVILLSGHGGRRTDDGHDEVDGYDEVFCPVDVEMLEATGGVGARGITDDEIGRWLTRISDRGANVWLIADSCHNGTLSRGGGDVPRGIGPMNLSRGDEVVVEKHEVPKGKVVAFYAAPPTRKTFDTSFYGVPYGLFSYTICNVLKHSAEPLTYRQLLEGVHREYRRMARRSPTPQMESQFKNTLVLGDIDLQRSDIRLSRDGDESWKVNAGRLHRITEDTILGVFANDQKKEQPPRGYVRVVRAETLQSHVKPCSQRGISIVDGDHLPLDGYCNVFRASLRGLRRISVAVDDRTVSREPLPNRSRQRWQSMIHHLDKGEQSLIRIVEQPAEADWLIQPATSDEFDTVYLSPADRFLQQSGDEALLMSPPNEKPEYWLEGKLADIARTCNLIEIAQHEIGRSSAQIKLEVELRLRDGDDDYEGVLIDPDAGHTLHPGDRIIVQIRNPNPFPVYASLLFVDGHYQTYSFFPDHAGSTEHRLESAGTRVNGKPADRAMPRFTVNGDTLGLEQLVAIAVRENPQREPPDFTFLAQAARGPDEDRSPLEDLLATVVYRDRGLTKEQSRNHYALEPHTFQVISWHTTAKVEYERGLLGRSRGPAENLDAQIVKEDSEYHTANRTVAVLGTYGRLFKSDKLDKLFRRPHRYEPQSLIQSIGGARSFQTLQRSGRGSGSALLSFVGKRQAWQMLNLSAEVTGGREREVEFELVGRRLDKKDVITALNGDDHARGYFAYLLENNAMPCVVLQNIVLTRYKATHAQNGEASVNAQPPHSADGLQAKISGQRETFVAFKSPVIRCYQVHEVLMNSEGNVVELVPIDP